MGEVVSPRAVAYSVTFHQWLTSGVRAMRTLPTIWVQRCSVSHVALHADSGSSGQAWLTRAAYRSPASVKNFSP